MHGCERLGAGATTGSRRDPLSIWDFFGTPDTSNHRDYTLAVKPDEAAVPVIWTPALCPACGVVSVNVADGSERS